MDENMSMTAEVSAFVRAYHTAEGGEICNDPLAVKLLGVGRFGQIAAQMTAGREWFLPGDTGIQEEALRRIVNQKLGPAVLARAAWWEQELRRELTMGLKQVLVRMFITNLKSILKIRLKAHIFPRTFADLLPLCYDYNTKH